MKLTVIGCSPAWPNPGSAHSGYLVEHDGDRLLLDCGPGVLARLRLREPWPRIDAIVFSHLHLDHCGDLPGWLWGSLAGPGRGLPVPAVWLPPGGTDEIARLTSKENFAKVFTFEEYADSRPFAAAGFELTARRMAHYDANAFGLRVERAGKALAYSGDTSACEALIDLGRSADLLLCEATLEEPETGALRGHLSASEARETATAARVARLVVTHRAVEQPPGAGIEVAYEGLEVEL